MKRAGLYLHRGCWAGRELHQTILYCRGCPWQLNEAAKLLVSRSAPSIPVTASIDAHSVELTWLC